MPANCCSYFYDLGCFPCGSLLAQLPITAPVTGTYVAHFKYLGTEILKEFEATLGDAIYVPIDGLNSDFTFDFYVLDPDGEKLTFGDFDCWRLQLHVARIGDDPEGIDLSGLSCAQLEALTQAQLIGCILPTYDFSDPEVLEALTDQQETDLEAAFGGEGEEDHYYAIAIGHP